MSSHYASRVIKLRLEKNGGECKVPMIRTTTTICLCASNAIMFEKVGTTVFPLETFDKVLHEANRLGGKMYLADSAARSGAKLGSPELPVTSIDGFIAKEVFGKEEGVSILGCSSYIAAVLKWIGVCVYSSDYKGRYISVREMYSKL